MHLIREVVVTLLLVPVLYAVFVLDLRIVQWAPRAAAIAAVTRSSLLIQVGPRHEGRSRIPWS